MEENQEAVAELTGETTSEASSPQAEEQTPQGNETDEIQSQEVEEDSGDSESIEMTDAQRKAFQEQRQEIKRLKEEVEARKKHESAFATFKNQGSQQVVTLDNFVNPQTNEVDWNSYNIAVQKQASAVANEQVQERLDEYEARQAHPELFSDPDTEEELASMWLFERYRGNNTSIKEIADRYAKRHNKAVSKAQKKGAEEALTELSAKEKASLEAKGQNASQAVAQLRAEDVEVMKERVRFGDTEALTNLMSNVSWNK